MAYSNQRWEGRRWGYSIAGNRSSHEELYIKALSPFQIWDHKKNIYSTIRKKYCQVTSQPCPFVQKINVDNFAAINIENKKVDTDFVKLNLQGDQPFILLLSNRYMSANKLQKLGILICTRVWTNIVTRDHCTAAEYFKPYQ